MRIWAATPDQTAASQASAARRGAIYGGIFLCLFNLFVLGISHVVRRRIEQCARFGHDVYHLGEALLWCERGKGISDLDKLLLAPLLALSVLEPEDVKRHPARAA